MGRLKEIIVQHISRLLKYIALRHKRRHCSERELEELAQSVLDYGRMMMQFHLQQAVDVEVDELAFRLRESKRDIAKVLHLLESRGEAERTELEGLWTLQIESQESRNRRKVAKTTEDNRTLLPANGRRCS